MSAVAGRKPVHFGGLSDEDLVRRSRAGDEEAFDAIVHRYRSPLVGYCRRWLDAHRAEEVVQHTLMKAFLCIRDDDRPLALRPWLYRVAHNAALNALEKKGSDWEELDENYDGVPQPPQLAEQRARFLRVVGEIESLPDRQREALLLNEFEGRCYADIATELGTSESGVRGLLRRARRQLREAAAAALLPFPMLRELVRGDAGRALPADRAGELIGTAGAAGGIGAAGGGLAKIAAGVLAAGTIAGGGAAIERGVADRGRDQKQPSTAVRSAERPVVEAADGVGRTLLAAGAGAPRGAGRTVSTSAAGAVDLIAGVGLGARGYEDAAFGGIAPETTEPDETGTVEPAPLLPTVPLLPLGEEPAAEEDAAAEEPVEEEPSAGDGDESQEPATDEEATTDGRDQAAADGDAQSGKPAATDQAAPAGPLTPQSP